MTQAAVDWFFENAVKLLKNPDDIESLNVYHFVAKQIFKDQIIEAHIEGQPFFSTISAKAEKYFKETYEDNK